jgi:hypothetical protein
VIDRPSNCLFVVAKTKKTGTEYHYRLHALDLATGAEKPGSPVEIQATVTGGGSGQDPPGSGSIPFDARRHLNRPGLLLNNGVLHIAFSSHADQTPYHGWVFAYDVNSLSQRAVFNTSPDRVPGQVGSLGDDGSGGGIWQSGIGPAADGEGYVYCLTGNGPYNAGRPSGRDYGDALLKLHLNGSFSVAGHFSPPNHDYINNADIDLGSGGVTILPEQPGVYRDLLVFCGKYAVIYLLHRCDMRVLQALQGGQVTGVQGGAWSGPAYYSSPNANYLYYCFSDDHLKAFRLANGKLSLGTLDAGGYNQTIETFPHFGASPIVSSDGQAPGTAVVWLVKRGNPLTLCAYEATDLRQKLFEADAGPWDNPEGAPFVEPTVANGKVYVGTANQLAVYGL